jgi:predicted nuclease of predicted toxin-antitoxin system
LALIAGKARFLVDESLGAEVAAVLCRSGYKAFYVRDVALAGHSDEDVFAYAYKKRLIVLTHDRGFLSDRRFPPHRNPGVIVLPGGDGNESALMNALSEVIAIAGDTRGLFWETKATIDEHGDWIVKMRDGRTGAMEAHRYKFPAQGPALIWRR